MNFAAQLFFSSYRNEALPRLTGHVEESDPFWQSEGERMAASQRSSGHKDSSLGNGCLSRRATPIHPERLKDFGEEDYLNGDVRMWDVHVVEKPSAHLTSTPKPNKHKRTQQEFQSSEGVNEYLRFQDISAAAFTIHSSLQRTPCNYSRLSKQYGMEIYLKKEHLHYTGSVKERGVLNLLNSLTQEQQRKGVIVASDTNFSLALTHHATELRIPVFVIMPANSSQARLRSYRDYGAVVISFGSNTHDAQRHAQHLAKENNYIYLDEDDSAVYMAGLGTVGLEIYDQVCKLDAVIIPAGGRCALLAGTAAALKHLNPRISIIGAEPQECPLLLQSLKNNCPVTETYSSGCRKLYGDLLDAPLGSQAFLLTKRLVDKVVSVREEDMLLGMLKLHEFERSMVDMEGAIGVAAVLSGQLQEFKGKRLAVLVSSANMNPSVGRQCVQRALMLDQQICTFSVQLGDKLGEMVRLLELLSREDVRLLHVCHHTNNNSELFKAQVECVVETRDRAHGVQLRGVLSERYATLHWREG